MNLQIGLDSWIIQDGNYTDFKKGEIREFALEFKPVGDLYKQVKQTKSELQHEELGEGKYKINAEVVYLETETRGCTLVSGAGKDRVEKRTTSDETLVVLDLGGVMVFHEFHGTSTNRRCCAKGSFVEGEIYIGIDPFFYKEGHCKRPGIPALTYSWKIEKIEMLMAPWIAVVEVINGKERRIHKRDETKISYKEIRQTNAWEDDDFGASYVLTVSKTPTPPKLADLVLN